MSDNIQDYLDIIDARLTSIAMYAERQAVALEKLVELTTTKKQRAPQVRFTPPTIDEVRAYVHESKAGINPGVFVDYYTARGWKLKGGETVKDWKACVRTWSRNGFGNKGPEQANESTGKVL